MQSGSPTLQFRVLPDDKIVEASHGESLLASILRRKIPLNHSCGGFGTCGTCRVLIVSGLERLSPRNEIEQDLANERGLAPEERLACQVEACAGIVIRRP